MKSPITGKEMQLFFEVTSLPFRKDEFDVVHHYYLCTDTKERFTNDQLDNINISQVHNQYREKYGIPFPEEIKNIREKYGVSATKISEILGFGPNSYRLYEAGEMPSVSNGRLILSINQPEEFIRQVKASSHILPEKDINKFIEVAKEVEAKEREEYCEDLMAQRIFQFDALNEYSGYKKPDLNKISQVIAFLDGKIELFKTKLNKLLFYVDFAMYKRHSYSMTGLQYRAVTYGPVPAEYEKLYLKLQDEKKLNIVEVSFENGNFGELIKANQEVDAASFSKLEMEVLENVISRFKGLTSKQIVDISHDELGWKENKDERKVISYQKYAFQLKALS